jgi:hypothetical protein
MLIQGIQIEWDTLKMQIRDHWETLNIAVPINLENLEETRRQFKKAIKATSVCIKRIKDYNRSAEYYWYEKILYKK